MTRHALKRLDSLIATDVDNGRLPGAVTLVWHRGRIVHHSAIGLRDPASPAPMAEDAIFRIYSMTKPLVSVALMMLVEEGRLQLRDPLSQHLPEFAEPMLAVEGQGDDGNPKLERVPLDLASAPTLHDLLRHTAGFTYGIFGQSALKSAYLAAGVERGNLANDAFVKRLATLPLAFPPGTVWEYGRATDVIGALIERVSGRSLGEFLRERIFAPLKMKDTGFQVAPGDDARLAEPFATDPDSGEAVRLLDVGRPPVFESGGGGLVSTAADYLRFCRALLGGGEAKGRRLLSPHTVRLMTANHLDADVLRVSRRPGATTGYVPGPGYGFGLGFAVRLADGGAPNPGHAGDYHWSGVGGTFFWIDPKEQLIAIWMMQAPGQRLHYRSLYKNLVYAAL